MVIVTSEAVRVMDYIINDITKNDILNSWLLRHYGGPGLPLEFGQVPASQASKAMYAIHVL